MDEKGTRRHEKRLKGMKFTAATANSSESSGRCIEILGCYIKIELIRANLNANAFSFCLLSGLLSGLLSAFFPMPCVIPS